MLSPVYIENWQRKCEQNGVWELGVIHPLLTGCTTPPSFATFLLYSVQRQRGHVALVAKREDLSGAIQRAIASRDTACVNVKCRGVISPIVAATADKRDTASIE